MIVILDELGEEARKLLLDSSYEISFDREDLYKAQCLIVRNTKVSKEMIQSSPNLKAIARAGIGIDSIDYEYAEEKGIKVFNAEGGNSVYAAETTIGLILSLAHKIAYAHNLLFEKKIWERGLLTEGFELEGKTLGIIGCGNVGSRVANFGLAFGMQVLIYDPYIEKFPQNTKKINSLQELLPQCDLITLHTPLTKETRHMIDEKSIAQMKDSAYLINASRGSVVKEEAIIHALKTKKLSGIALDVFEEEPLPKTSALYEFDNIVMIPHLGGAGKEARARVSRIAVQKILDFRKTL